MDRSIPIPMKGLRREDKSKIVPFSQKSVPEDFRARYWRLPGLPLIVHLL